MADPEALAAFLAGGGKKKPNLTTMVTSPKRLKPSFLYFFGILGPRYHVQGLLLALKFIFLGRKHFLDSYLLSYCTFRRF